MQGVDRFEAEPWSIDGFAIVEGRMYIDGWAFPEAGNPVTSRFSINGKAAQTAVAVDRPDVAALFARRKHARHCGFHLEHLLAPSESLLDIHCASLYDTPRSRARNSVFVPLRGAALDRPVPTAEQRYRVIGNRDLNGFLRIGSTDAQKLLALIRFDFPDLSELRVLDWGVGCGRVARHVCDSFGEFTGVDIDADNVRWCADNLPGRYATIGLRDGTRFADGSFDAIYGVSVFTHLREELQNLWLAELRRLLRPGGRAYVTVHGTTAVEYGCRAPAETEAALARLRREGFYIASENTQLAGYVPEPDEYLNVFHHSDYVRQHWQAGFRSLEIIPGYIYTHDLVVLER